MSQAQPSDPGANRRSQNMARHRRESFWQITFPMLLILIVLLGAVALVIVLSGAQGISSMADVSLVLVSLPLLLIGLLPLALILGLMIGLGWLLRETPAYTRIVQDVTARVSSVVQNAIEQVTRVIVSVMTGFSMARDFLSTDRKNGSDNS